MCDVFVSSPQIVKLARKVKLVTAPGECFGQSKRIDLQEYKESLKKDDRSPSEYNVKKREIKEELKAMRAMREKKCEACARTRRAIAD